MKKKHKNKVVPGKGITNPKLAKKLNRILIEKNLSKEKFAEKLGEPLPYILEVLKGTITYSYQNLQCIKYTNIRFFRLYKRGY